MAPASSLFPRGGSPHTASQGSILRRANNLPALCPRHFSDDCFHTVGLQIACLPSLWEQYSALQAPSHPSMLTFKAPSFRKAGAYPGLLRESLAALGLKLA